MGAAASRPSPPRQRRDPAAMPGCRIAWTTPDGEEREEAWPSVAAFLAWAAGEGRRLAWRAYAEAEDGEWELVDEGKV
jgi:hypothetical protein